MHNSQQRKYPRIENNAQTSFIHPQMTKLHLKPPQLASTPLSVGPGALASVLHTFTTARDVRLESRNPRRRKEGRVGDIPPRKRVREALGTMAERNAPAFKRKNHARDQTTRRNRMDTSLQESHPPRTDVSMAAMQERARKSVIPAGSEGANAREMVRSCAGTGTRGVRRGMLSA